MFMEIDTDSMTRPAKLTAEIVLKKFSPMIRHQIRKFQIVTHTEDDLFNSCIAHLIAPSKSSGITALDRYDSKIGYASTYLTTVVSNYLKAVYRQDRRELEHFQDCSSVTLSNGNVVDSFPESIIEADEVFEPVDQTVARRSLLKALRTQRNKEYSSVTPRGKPRTTFRVVLMLLNGKTIAQIAEAMSVSQVEVRRRLSLLRNDPSLQRIAEDYGWMISERAAG
jgi:RNA polymerase sigma factor (sigma-70 family)